MSKKEFLDFINRQKPPVAKDEKPIDWSAEKEQWLEYLNKLYQMVEYFLKEFIDDNRIITNYKSLMLSEENIGQYEVRALTLIFGTNQIKLTPVGTLLIGTKGRVDMTGPKGTVRLILADKDSTGHKFTVRVLDVNEPAAQEESKLINWEWKVVVTNAPRISYQKLTQETFFNAIMEVSNG
jgi:hypothetical protein